MALTLTLALGCSGGGGGSASTTPSPAFTTTAPTTATVGRVYAYQVAASEAGSTVTLAAPTLPDGAAFTAASGTLTWTPTYAQAGSTQAFVLTATDSAGRSTDQGWSVTPGRPAAVLAAGGTHSLVLRNDGTVLAWGSNANGQLGTGTIANSAVPVQGSGLANATVVAAGSGSDHSLALDGGGSIRVWGRDAQGQLGLGRSIRSLVPLQAALGPAVTCLSAWPLPAAAPNGPATISFFPVDPGGATLAWTATLTSGGGSLSSASGGPVASDSQVLLTFTPSADATATVSIQVMSSGQGHPTATRSIQIPVTVPN